MHELVRFPRRLRGLAAGLVVLAQGVRVSNVLAADAPSAGVQSPAASWRTVETAHVVFHYPEAFSTFAGALAPRMEAIHEAVAAFVGYRPRPEAGKITVLLADPQAMPNGFAFPFLRDPYIILWPGAPESDSEIGEYRDWGELLFAHEMGHVVHMARPRNRKPRLLQILLPLGPLTLAPRWVYEGYATVLEGRLTGEGRPGSAARAALLRRWAADGRLPSYGQLASSGAWRGGSFAYLAGSAFLEWLEAREGEGSLLTLWKSVTRREGVPFARAFEKTFGRSPADLYARFVAELTAAALEEEKRLGAAGRSEGEAWQRFSGGTSGLEVSPDGTRLVVARAPIRREGELAVYTLEPTKAEEEKRKRHEEAEKKRLADPEEPKDKPETPRRREPLHRLTSVDHAAPREPRFLPDGKRVLHVRRARDPYGVLHKDLFLWEPTSGRVERVTRFADVSMPDPHPDGRRAFAVRQRFGTSELVEVDLQAGAVRPLAPAGLASYPLDVWNTPRVSPDGKRLVALRHHAGAWGVILVDLGTGSARPMDLGGARPAGAPAWMPSGESLLVTTDREGTWNLEQVDLSAGGMRRLTRTLGAVSSPAPTPDGRSVFFTSIEPDGAGVNRIALDAVPAAGLPPDSGARAAYPLRPPVPRAAPPPFASSAVGSTPYSPLASMRVTVFGGGETSPSGSRLEGIVGGEDAISRLVWNVAGAGGWDGGTSGAGFAARWRGWQEADVLARLFWLRERPGARSTEPRPDRDRERWGGEVLLERDRRWDHGAWALSAGALLADERPAGSAGFGRMLGHGGLVASLEREREKTGFGLDLTASGAVGRSGGDGWCLGRAGFSGRARTPVGTFRAVGEEGWTGGTPSRFDVFTVGGAMGSLTPAADALFVAESLALPAAVLAGERLETWRAEWALGPAVLYGAGFRAFGGPYATAVTSTRIAGLDLRLDLPEPPIPVGGRLTAVLGVARILEDPMKNRTVGYFSLAVRP